VVEFVVGDAEYPVLPQVTDFRKISFWQWEGSRTVFSGVWWVLLLVDLNLRVLIKVSYFLYINLFILRLVFFSSWKSSIKMQLGYLNPIPFENLQFILPVLRIRSLMLRAKGAFKDDFYVIFLLYFSKLSLSLSPFLPSCFYIQPSFLFQWGA
jgi:hypothetical protein